MRDKDKEKEAGRVVMQAGVVGLCVLCGLCSVWCVLCCVWVCVCGVFCVCVCICECAFERVSMHV